MGVYGNQQESVQMSDPTGNDPTTWCEYTPSPRGCIVASTFAVSVVFGKRRLAFEI